MLRMIVCSMPCACHCFCCCASCVLLRCLCILIGWACGVRRALGQGSLPPNLSVVSNDDDDANEDKCPICLESLDSISTKTTIECGHTFCSACYTKLAYQQGKSGADLRCPLCRGTVVAGSGTDDVAMDVGSGSEDDYDESCCIFADCRGLPAGRPVLNCAGDGCSVWAHRDCVRRHLSDGRRLPRRAYCETCLTQNPELANQDHICLNPSQARLQAYAAERAEQSDDDASQRLASLSSLPAGLSSSAGRLDEILRRAEMNADRRDADDETYVPSESDTSSTNGLALRRRTRVSGGAPPLIAAAPSSLQFDHAGSYWQSVGGPQVNSAASVAQNADSLDGGSDDGESGDGDSDDGDDNDQVRS